MQDTGTQNIKGYGCAGQQEQGNPDICAQDPQPAFSSCKPCLTTIVTADSRRIAFLDTPIGVVCNLTGVHTRVTIGCQSQDCVLHPELKGKTRFQVSHSGRKLGPLHGDRTRNREYGERDNEHEHERFDSSVMPSTQ